jgi:2-oxoglutarate ferredoxin oxidoreductase subunit alpha
VPSITATSGPGLARMTESIGLAIASETPIVVGDVMRGGPSTGIPTKAEQSDLNIALYGMHGDAPHLVLAPNTVTDCIFTTQWAVHLAETLQTAAIVLSDQSLGQAQAIVDEPRDHHFDTRRRIAVAAPADGPYRRYEINESGVSAMAIPGTPGCQYTADGLEHSESGLPSSMESDHVAQMDKRLRKLTAFDYGADWADIEGEGDTALITWGSCTGAAREALARLRAQGHAIRLVSIRLLSPVQPERFRAALAGVRRALVVEQSHSGQFAHYLRSYYDLPADLRTFCRPGPLTVRPAEICQQFDSWSQS